MFSEDSFGPGYTNSRQTDQVTKSGIREIAKRPTMVTRNSNASTTVSHYVSSVDIDWGTVRVRATSYVTRVVAGQPQLLIFDYPLRPDEPAVLPGGGIEAGERPDHAAIREVIEETGIDTSLEIKGIVGVQQGTYNTGLPCINIFFHLNATEQRTQWTHQMIGDPIAWDTGLDVRVRFEPLAVAAERLRAAGHRQEAFIDCLSFDGIRETRP